MMDGEGTVAGADIEADGPAIKCNARHIILGTGGVQVLIYLEYPYLFNTSP